MGFWSGGRGRAGRHRQGCRGAREAAGRQAAGAPLTACVSARTAAWRAAPLARPLRLALPLHCPDQEGMPAVWALRACSLQPA